MAVLTPPTARPLRRAPVPSLLLAVASAVAVPVILATVVVTSAGGRAPWEYADWAATPAGAWMKANA